MNLLSLLGQIKENTSLKNLYSQKLSDMVSIAKIPESYLYHDFVDALKDENYEFCAKVRDEFKRRFETHTFCEFAFVIFYRSDAPMYGLLDYADAEYLILPEI